MYDIIVLAFLALMILATKTWYHTWYHGFFYDIMYDITKPAFSSLSCATTLWFRLCYHIHITIFWLWYQQLMILAMISAMIYPLISTTSYIIALWYHSPLISCQNFHVIVAVIMVPARRDGAACGRHAPAAPPPPASPSHAKRRCIEAIGASSMDLEFKLEWYYSSSCGTGMASQRRALSGGKSSSCYYVLGIGQS
jgi:hypothetical protein